MYATYPVDIVFMNPSGSSRSILNNELLQQNIHILIMPCFGTVFIPFVNKKQVTQKPF
jgi:hypothetical protein